MSNLNMKRWQLGRREVLRGLGATHRPATPRRHAARQCACCRGGREAETQRVSLHPQRREHADVADRKGGRGLRVHEAAEVAGKASGGHHADQRPASSDGAGQASQLRKGLADGRQRAGRRRRLPQHACPPISSSPKCRERDAVLVAGDGDRGARRWHGQRTAFRFPPSATRSRFSTCSSASRGTARRRFDAVSAAAAASSISWPMTRNA